MEQAEALGLRHVRLALLLRQGLPLAPEAFGDLGVVDVRLDLDDAAALYLRPHHEGVHRALDVVRGVLLGLEKSLKNIVIYVTLEGKRSGGGGGKKGGSDYFFIFGGNMPLRNV